MYLILGCVLHAYYLREQEKPQEVRAHLLMSARKPSLSEDCHYLQER